MGNAERSTLYLHREKILSSKIVTFVTTSCVWDHLYWFSVWGDIYEPDSGEASAQ